MSATMVTYTGGLPPGGQTVDLFNSVTTFGGAGRLPATGQKFFDLDVEHSQQGQFNAFFSNDGGTSWVQYFGSGSIQVPAGALSTQIEIPLSGRRDVRVEFENDDEGAQLTFNTQLSLDSRKESRYRILPVRTGLILDLDADRGVIRNAIDGRVEQWRDQSGLGNHASQSTSANRPAFSTANMRFRGKPSVNGDGLAFWMEVNGIAPLLTGNDTPFYVIRASRLQTESTGNVLTVENSGDSTNFHRLTHTANVYQSLRRGGDAQTTASSTAVIDETDNHIVEVAFDGSVTTHREDGVDVSNTTAQANAAITVDQGVLFARRILGVASAFGDDELARVAVFTPVPPASTQQRLRKAFSRWYGPRVV